MSLSSIKDLWQKIKNSNENEKVLNKTLSPEDFRLISDYMTQKFGEVREIFSKFNSEDYYSFIENSTFIEFSENDLIFAKNTLCDAYLFILHGDIDFFDNPSGGSENNILIKTISAGKVYGHLVKENYKYDLKARTNISIVSIKKKVFDDLIININKMKIINKFKFIKKFFPKIRLYSDDIINNVLQYFERVKFNKHSKIFLKDEYNEYVYLIIKGQIAFCVRPKGLFHMDKIDKSLINDELIEEINTNIYNNDYIIIDKLSRGDVFGINSALKGQKSLCTIVTLTENVEVYRILKGNILFYFGGSGGILPVSLKALGSLEDDSCLLKIDYLKSIDFSKKDIISLLKTKFSLKFDKNENLRKNKKIKKGENYFIIDENSIKNNLFEAWKSFENLGSKISEFKSKLLGEKPAKKKNIFGEEIGDKTSSSNGVKDFNKVTGDATNRVVSRKLKMGLNMNQIKSLDKLNMLCGVKKNADENIKKVANITSKVEGHGRSKLMSFMKSDDSLNTLEGFSKRANEKAKKAEEEKKVEEEKKAEEEKKKEEEKNAEEEKKSEEEKNIEEEKNKNNNNEKLENNNEQKENNEKKEINENNENNEKTENNENKGQTVNNTEKKENIENNEKKEINESVEKTENKEKKEINENNGKTENNENKGQTENNIEKIEKKEEIKEEKEKDKIEEKKDEIKKENVEVKKDVEEIKKENPVKEKPNKAKRVKNSLRKLRDLE